MSTITADNLKVILRTSAGEDESTHLDGDFLDISFVDLGYDSLALLETVALVKREYGVTISDEHFADVLTPRSMLNRINLELARV